MAKWVLTIILFFSALGFASDQPIPRGMFRPADSLLYLSEALNQQYRDFTAVHPLAWKNSAGTEIMSFHRETCFDNTLTFEVRRRVQERKSLTHVTILCSLAFDLTFTIQRIGDDLPKLTIQDLVGFRFPKEDDQEELFIQFPLRQMDLLILNPPSGNQVVQFTFFGSSSNITFRYREQHTGQGLIFTFTQSTSIESPTHHYRIQAQESSASSRLFEYQYFYQGQERLDPQFFLNELEINFAASIRSRIGI